MLLFSSDTRRTLIHLFLFTNSAQLENWFQYVHTQSIRDRNELSLIPWSGGIDRNINKQYQNIRYENKLIATKMKKI